MDEEKYESYPYSAICLSTAQTVLSYLIGALILYLIGGLVLAAGYLVLCLIVFIFAMRFRCSHCYYYGKRCPFGWVACQKCFSKREIMLISAIPETSLLWRFLILLSCFCLLSWDWFLSLSDSHGFFCSC